MNVAPWGGHYSDPPPHRSRIPRGASTDTLHKSIYFHTVIRNYNRGMTKGISELVIPPPPFRVSEYRLVLQEFK